MEKTKKSSRVGKALMMGSAMVSLNALAISDVRAADFTGMGMSAVILDPIAVTVQQILHFGRLTATAVPGTATGTLLIDTASARTAGGSVTDIADGGGITAAAGILRLTAATGINIDFSLVPPAPDYTVTNGGGQSMVVDNFNFSTASGANGTLLDDITVPVAGFRDINVGATLQVPAGLANRPAGVYTGSYTVRANYD